MERRRLKDEETEMKNIDYGVTNWTPSRNQKEDLLLEVEVTESLDADATAGQKSVTSDESLIEVTIIRPKEGSSLKEFKPFQKSPSKIEERRDLERKLAEIKAKLAQLSNESIHEEDLPRKINIDYRPIKSKAAARSWLQGLVKKSASADVPRDTSVVEQYLQLLSSMKDLEMPLVQIKPGRKENMTGKWLLNEYYPGDGKIAITAKDERQNLNVMSGDTVPNAKLPHTFHQHRNQSYMSAFLDRDIGITIPAHVDGKIDYDVNTFAKQDICYELKKRLQHENVGSAAKVYEKNFHFLELIKQLQQENVDSDAKMHDNDVLFELEKRLREKKVDDGKAFDNTDVYRLQQTKVEDGAKAYEDLGIYSDLHKRLQVLPQNELLYSLQLDVSQIKNAQTKGHCFGAPPLDKVGRRVILESHPAVETRCELSDNRASLIEEYMRDVNYQSRDWQPEERGINAELACPESFSSSPSEICDFCGMMDCIDTNCVSALHTRKPFVERVLIPLSSRERLLGYISADEHHSMPVYRKPLFVDQATDTDDDIGETWTNLAKPKKITPPLLEPRVIHLATETVLHPRGFPQSSTTDYDSFECTTDMSPMYGESDDSENTNENEKKIPCWSMPNESKQLTKDAPQFRGKPSDAHRVTYESVGVQTSFLNIGNEPLTNDSLKDNAKNEYDSAHGPTKQRYVSKGVGKKKVVYSSKSQMISSESEDYHVNREKSVHHREKLRNKKASSPKRIQPENFTRNTESQDNDVLEKSTAYSLGNNICAVMRVQDGSRSVQEKRHHKCKRENPYESVQQHDKVECSSCGKQTQFEDSCEDFEKLHKVNEEVYFNTERRNVRERSTTEDKAHRQRRELYHGLISDDGDRMQHLTPEVAHQRASSALKERYPSSYNSSEKSHKQSDNHKSAERSRYWDRKCENTCRAPARRGREILSSPEASHSFESQEDTPPTVSDTEIESWRSQDINRARGVPPESSNKWSTLPKVPEGDTEHIWTWDDKKLTPGFDLKSGVEKLLLDHLEKKCLSNQNTVDPLFQRKSDHLTQDVEQELCRKLRENNKLFMDDETLSNLISKRKMLQNPVIPQSPLALTPNVKDTKTPPKVCRQEYVAITSSIGKFDCNNSNSLHVSYLKPFANAWNSISPSYEPVMNTVPTRVHGDNQNTHPLGPTSPVLKLEQLSTKTDTSVSKPATISLNTSQETFNSFKETKQLIEEQLSCVHDFFQTKNFLKCKVANSKLRTNLSEQSLTRTKQNLDSIRKNSKTSMHLNRTMQNSPKKCVVGNVRNCDSNGEIKIEIVLLYQDLKKLWYRQKRRKRLVA